MNPLQNFYEVIDILKTGKIGKVLLVYDKIGKQICILKERNLNSAELYKKLKKIKNPALPEIYRTVEFGGVLFVVEEFIDGRTLADIFNFHGAFNENFSAQILKQLCNCLKILHAEKIIHRDIKPSNIMLTKNNSVKLIDFSISRFAKNNSESDTDFLGTRGYAPPEQFGFGQTDSRSDIFSLGKTFQKILGDNYNGYLKKILQKCTELDPANRYQNVEEISADIDKKFWTYKLKKFALHFCIFSTIFSASLFFNVEKLTDEKISPPVESPAVKKSVKIPEKVQDSYKFPEIKMPTPENLPETAPEIKNLPEKNIPVSDARLKNFCTLYLNNKIFSSEITANVWQNWRRDGDLIFFPADWTLTLKIENKNNFALNDIKIAVTLNGDKKIFSASIPANTSKNFTIPLGSYNFSADFFTVDFRLDCGENIFAWQGGSFGNYKNFKIYLLNYQEWRVKNL